jgi:hypothetical protein
VKGFVTLKVFDILGREVATLVHEWKDADDYRVEFDTQYPTHFPLASGIYFYRLSALDSHGKVLYIETKSMTLVR